MPAQRIGGAPPKMTPRGGRARPPLGASMQGLQQAASINNTMPGGAYTPPPPVAPIGPIDMTASNAATFGRAKDTQGALGRASLDSLRGLLGETGQMGSGAEVQGSRDIVQSAAGELGQVNRDLATTNANQAFQVAQTNYQGQIAQRAQDLAAQQAAAQLAQQQAEAEAASKQQLALLEQALGTKGPNASGVTPGPSWSNTPVKPTGPKPWEQPGSFGPGGNKNKPGFLY